MKKTVFIIEKVLLAILCGFLLIIPFDKYLGKILCYSAVVFWLALNILKYKSKFYRGFFSRTFSNKAIAVFFLAAVISTIFSLKPYHSQEILFQRYLPYFVLFFLGVDLTRNSIGPVLGSFFGRKISLSNIGIIAGSFLLLGAIIGIGGVWDYFRFHPGRLWTVFGKKISFYMLPVYLVYFTPFSFAFFVCAKNKLLKAVGFITFGLLFFVLVCNGSRGAWVAVAISLIFIVLFSKRKKYIFFSFLIAVVILLIMPQNYQQRMKGILNPSAQKSYIVRKELSGSAIRIFKDYPIFGIGPGMYEKLLYEYAPVGGYSEGNNFHVHNTYLEVLCEMGIVGLLAFLWIFVVFFKNVFRPIRLCRDRNSQVIQIGLAGSILAGLIFALSCTIITVGFQDTPIFWLLFGVVAGSIPQEKRNISEMKQSYIRVL